MTTKPEETKRYRTTGDNWILGTFEHHGKGVWLTDMQAESLGDKVEPWPVAEPATKAKAAG